ncbi:universal stress protein [Mycobacterium parmense]|uniref:Universal stress protein n=1 Tax=Mycobacterium parmense TaxID=185642 RepID=A0A7I7YSV5_9MYCO|nr:universal stress protein [Mycobacterium parmense]MCV7351744.1 universal stress protein [Mycobacterium parmense]ORW60157.1 universal stress protein [Mycobacterium parmense]BBZ44789.1 universal stress protein [Mycobacterium parmense]
MKPVMVGIDGSRAAVAAALWACDEAIGRGVPLHLTAVIKATHPSPDDYARDLAHAETALRAAQSAIEASGKPVVVEAEVLRGPPAPVLVEASRDAVLVCVGSVGIGRYARSILGSAATELAERAHCPVAVIRSGGEHPPPDVNWIVVRMSDAPDNDAVVGTAATEARLRRAPLLVLAGRPEDLTDHEDGVFVRRIEQWRQRHPDVRVYPILSRAAIASFLRANHERVQLAVISGSEADQLAKLVGPAGHPLFRHPECSVLVVRR